MSLNELSSALQGIATKYGDPSRPCALARLAAEMDEEAQTLVLRLTEEKKVPIRQIHNQLKQAGLSIARDTISNHRNSDCTCTAATS